MRHISLPYGREGRAVDLPEHNLIGVLEGKEAPTGELVQEFDRAWRNPIGINDPETVFHPGERVVFAVTDHTRSTPTREILPLIWGRIRNRVQPNDVTIIVATGIHRSPTEEELEAMLGDLRREFRVVIHDCDRNHIEIGRSARGTPILIARIVAEADHVVTLGHIGMHYYAGYSGGRKNILPGVAGRETIEVNHAQLTDPHCEGCVYQENPISEEMSEAARLVGVDFIVDCVFDAHGRVAKIVVGDVEKAHAVGRAFWDSLFQVESQERADLVIVSAGGHPKDIDLYQAYKALYNAGRVVKEGGMILLVAACPDGIGNDLFEDWMMRCERPEDVFGILEEEGFKLGGHKAVYLAKDLARAQIALVSEMEDELVRRFFLTPIIDPNEILALAHERFGDGFRILVMPHGTDTFPLVSD
jgi:nickel-dependent lactate racemase